MHLEDLARWRQVAYRLFSSILLYPDEGRLKTIATAAAELDKQNQTMVKFAFFPYWQRLLASLADFPGQHILEEEYIRVFMHSSEGAPCLPYESVYMDPDGQATGWILAMLEKEYADAGLMLPSSRKELPDHAAVELEFMAYLCGHEMDVWNGGVIRNSIQILERQAAFLGKHLIRWVPRWAQQVAAVDGEGIYSIVVATVWAFVSHDQDLISTLLDKLQGAPEVVSVGRGNKVT